MNPIKPQRYRYIGIAFAVTAPAGNGGDFSNTFGKRKAGSPMKLEIAVDNSGPAPTFSIMLDGRMVANLNRADALEMGIALVSETNR